MSPDTKHRLAEAFNRRADVIGAMSNDQWRVAGTALLALAALPCSATTALFILAVPTIYQSVGVTCRATASMLSKGPTASP